MCAFTSDAGIVTFYKTDWVLWRNWCLTVSGIVDFEVNNIFDLCYYQFWSMLFREINFLVLWLTSLHQLVTCAISRSNSTQSAAFHS